MRYRSLGFLHCPRCRARREYFWEDPNESDSALAECCECGHQFGYKIDELAKGGPRRIPVLDAKLVARVQEERRKQYEESMLSSGYRRENFTLGRTNQR